MTEITPSKVAKLNQGLFKAIEKSDLRRVGQLLEDGADANAAIVNGYTHAFTPLHYAAQCGEPEIAKLLLSNGANAQARTKSESGGAGEVTPLLSALKTANRSNNYLDTVKLLLASGADPNVEDNGGFSPLQLAVSGGWDAVVDLLLKCGATTHQNEGMKYPCIHSAANSGHLALLERLTDLGVPVDQLAADGTTSLIMAGAHPDIVRWLLDHGANVNHSNENGETALIRVAILVWYLPDYEDEQHSAALVSARLLVERGADLSVKDAKGRSALDYAKMAERKELYDFLRIQFEGKSLGSPPRIKTRRKKAK